MTEWTEQEEQEIIDRAKAGDPEANFELSQWALRRGEEEPDEPRWNRLAAKCLVKAAQAGYGPAKEQMDTLLHPDKPRKIAAAPPAARQTKLESPVDLNDARQAVSRRAPVQQTTARHVSARKMRSRDDEDAYDDEDSAGSEDDDVGNDWDDSDEYDDAPARRSRRGQARSGRSRDSRQSDKRERDSGPSDRRKWGDAQWRKMEIICVVICAILLVFIAAMIFRGQFGFLNRDASGTSSVPPADQVAPAATSNVEVVQYPDEATRSAIMAADLSIQPENEDYVTAPTSATVSVGNTSLRMRKGPNTTYDQSGEIPDEAVVSVYAQKNDWYLVLYEGDNGATYGWCNSQYLILGAGNATVPTDDPNASVG